MDPRSWWAEEFAAFAGGHSGYERLPSAVRTHRTVVLDRRAPRFVVVDRLEGAGIHRLQWRFHLDPQLSIACLDSDLRFRRQGREVWLLPVDGVGTLQLITGWVSPTYGVKHGTSTVSCVIEGPLPITRTWLFAESRLPAPHRREYVEHLTTMALSDASNSSQ
jgi:hypothetical protein